jgi:peptidyl-prolyl cis-trans isomerase SurA
MKRVALFLYLFSFISVAFAGSNDAIIMKIGNKNITKSEFEYIWSKNNTNNTLDKKSLNEYVDLFVNFKLKVAEAEGQGIDTTKSFINELSGYRRQLISPYLTDKDADSALFRQTYDRIREYVEASHILIKLDQDASPEDTLAAWQKINRIYNQAIKGVDFAKLAKENSDDNSKNDGGYLGFATGFRYVYPFENAVYNTSPGKISKPFRTQFGYHIVKVLSRREAGGRYRSGHILKLATKDASQEVQLAAKEAIYQIYDSIKNGADFQKFAETQSDDKGAAANKGEYGFLYCGSLPIEYEDAVYALKPGEVSKPFHSNYGWHIVKALEFLPYPSMDEMKNDINNIIGRDERSLTGKASLAEKLKKEYSYTPFDENSKAFEKAWDNLRLNHDSTGVRNLQKSDLPIFTLDGKPVAQSLFADYVIKRGSASNNMKAVYSDFVKDKVLAYEDSRLEIKYPEFGHLMQEYRDGILLFEVSNREVWDKATKDTAGLEKYFAAHKADYAWDKPHYKGFVVSCADKKTASKAKKLLKGLAPDSIATVLKKTFNTDSTTLVKIEKGLYTAGENPVIDSLVFKIKNPKQDLKFPVKLIKGTLLKNGPESYTDVRGLVISDYQNYLEKEWIDGLKKKFKVTIYEDVVNTVNKD